MTPQHPLYPGGLHLVDLGEGQGAEQSGVRPVLVISNPDHVDIINKLVTVLPCTTRDRGWPNHVLATGPTNLTRPSLIMTEQVRTISRARILRKIGDVDSDCLSDVMGWVDTWLA